MVDFYLGIPEPSWMPKTNVPLFVSHLRLRDRKTLPRAAGEWALDSGAFSELSQRGAWTFSPPAYVLAVRRYAQDVGNLSWAAIQDWMCEEFVLKKTGLTVEIHQQRTVLSYLKLRMIAPDLPFVPVLQGYVTDDYLSLDLYDQTGVDIRTLPRVGLGSICRRQGTAEILNLVKRLVCEGLRLHGFGVKSLGLPQLKSLLRSVDSMAWSFKARREKIRMDGHTHGNCASCLPYALYWRENLLNRI